MTEPLDVSLCAKLAYEGAGAARPVVPDIDISGAGAQGSTGEMPLSEQSKNER